MSVTQSNMRRTAEAAFASLTIQFMILQNFIRDLRSLSVVGVSFNYTIQNEIYG
jgi:hypothetical protein